jgi:hypothetical protein
LGGGLAGSAVSNGKAKAVATTGVPIVVKGLTGGRKNRSVEASEFADVTFGIKAVLISAEPFAGSVPSVDAVPCAWATATLPSNNTAAAKSLFMMFPSAG